MANTFVSVHRNASRARCWPAVMTSLLLTTSISATAQSTGTDTTSSSTSARTTGSTFDREGYSWLPGTRSGYIGLNVGRPEFNTGCGNGLYGCDDPSARVHLYTGGMVNDWWGLELGYLYEGSSERGGGRQRAEGVNLSAVVRLPLDAFNVYAKAGALYGRTRVSAEPLSGIDGGERRGWGAALALGAGFDFTPRSGVVLELSRNEFRFPARGGRQNVDALSLGYVHRF